ncbi:MAG: hypothetical protein IPO08_19760 [Xanthomonadales bacterium]|nr:hypothetical protein [Xanthomonadales bacterium]
MTAVSDFLTQAANYIDDGSRAIVEGLTDDQFAILVAATDEWSGGGTEPGIDSTLVRTHETFADFDASRASHWSQRGCREELVVGAPAVKFEDVQMFKGQSRHTFIVVDLGDYRVVVK